MTVVFPAQVTHCTSHRPAPQHSSWDRQGPSTPPAADPIRPLGWLWHTYARYSHPSTLTLHMSYPVTPRSKNSHEMTPPRIHDSHSVGSTLIPSTQYPYPAHGHDLRGPDSRRALSAFIVARAASLMYDHAKDRSLLPHHFPAPIKENQFCPYHTELPPFARHVPAVDYRDFLPRVARRSLPSWLRPHAGGSESFGPRCVGSRWAPVGGGWIVSAARST